MGPTGAVYSTKISCLLTAHPDLFEGLPWTSSGSERVNGRSDHGGVECQECGRAKGANGVGSMHCHVCSGVDNLRLKDAVLWPAMRRQKLRRDLLLKDDEDDAEGSSQFGSDAASSTTWGADTEATTSRQASKTSKSSAPGRCGNTASLEVPVAAAARRVSRRRSV